MTSTIEVWWIPQVPMKAFRYTVPDLATGKLLCDALARYDLFQYENRVKPDYCNAGGIRYALVDNPTEDDWDEVDPDCDADEWAYHDQQIAAAAS